jgi:enoyl-[acyl-carrier protein] reductase I
VAVSRLAKEILKENASIVTLTYYGSTKVLENYNVMGIAKAALECSVRYLASNLGDSGIRVNAVSAGPIKTLSAKGIKDFNKILDIVEKRAPLKRNVSIKEVGDTVAFLFSDLSSCVTGQIIFADSGYSIMGM